MCHCSFTGSFHCPVAADFCQFETVSGVQYPEFQAWQVWVIVGPLIGIPALLLLLCLIPPVQVWLVGRLRQW